LSVMLRETKNVYDKIWGWSMETNHISIDEFRGLDMRVGTVVSVERVKKLRDRTR